MIFSIIPIVNFIVVGYAARVASETPENNAPPPLSGYSSLFIEGLKVLIAGIIYMIVPLLLLGPSLFAISSIPLVGPTPGVILGGFAIVALIAGVVLAFLLSIVFYMAVINMIKQKDFGKAFAFGEIFDIIRSVGWGAYILWVIALLVIVFIVGLIGLIPIIGWLLSIIISPAVSVFIFRSAALVYTEGRRSAVAPGTSQSTYPPPPPPPPPSVTSQQTVNFCSSCGASIEPGSKFCPKCGKPL
ncbi:MAG: DUF4013 domain-containing protein [Candidatus Verstraetearchaeota archaeon]|nr:DUF4013 domain-containing protein [Candidatus Verstraetearchaeota archaeon]